jgi:hypothetical protein
MANIKSINETIANARAARSSIKPGMQYAAQVKADTAKILESWKVRKDLDRQDFIQFFSLA